MKWSKAFNLGYPQHSICSYIAREYLKWVLLQNFTDPLKQEMNSIIAIDIKCKILQTCRYMLT